MSPVSKDSKFRTRVLGALVVVVVVVGAGAGIKGGIDSGPITPPPPPPPPPPNTGSCTVSNRATWGPTYEPGECSWGTVVTRTNADFLCTAPLSNLGTLPIRVIITSTTTWGNGAAGAFEMNTGCTGDGNDDTIDLMLELNGNGVNTGVVGDALKFKPFAGAGPHDIQLTMSVDCGDTGGHYDTFQNQANNATGSSLAIINGRTGNYASGRPTCQGAGGALFWSNDADISILGGEYITCNHGLNGNTAHSGAGSVVRDAKFKTGNGSADGAVCGSTTIGQACWHTTGMTLSNVTCLRWNGSAYVADDDIPQT